MVWISKAKSVDRNVENKGRAYEISGGKEGSSENETGVIRVIFCTKLVHFLPVSWDSL